MLRLASMRLDERIPAFAGTTMRVGAAVMTYVRIHIIVLGEWHQEPVALRLIHCSENSVLLFAALVQA